MSENNVSSKAEILHHKQSVSLNASKMSAGQRASDAYYSNLSTVIDSENKSSGLVSLHEQHLMSEKNGSSKSVTLHYKRSVSIADSNKSVASRDFNGCYSMLNMATERGNKMSGFDRLIGHPWSDMVNNEELMMSERNASSKSETLHRMQSVSVDESTKSAGPSDFDGCYSVINTTTKHENNLSGIVKFIGHPISDMVKNVELTTSDKNITFKSETFHYTQLASVDESTLSAGWRDSDDCYTMLNLVTECENNLSDFRKPIRHPGSDIINNKELMTSDKNVTSKSETFRHKQSASVDESTKSAGWRDFDECYSMANMVKECGKLIGRPGSDVNNEEFMDGKNLSSKSETLHHTQSARVDECTESAGQIDGWSMLNTGTECENKLSGFGKLIGHYLHPKPVLSVLFCSKGNEAYICTSCGTSQDKQRTLFMYKLKIEGTNAGCPSFIGHSHMLLPDPKRICGRQIPADRSGMQFTPNGESLVLLNGMQVPCCRNGLLQCQCLECKSHGSEENAVKIVHLKHGYVSVLVKLKTVCRVVCLLVCEPNYLVAVEADGAFHLWSMDATWRLATEEFIMPATHCISPCAVELKQIPNCSHLVVGHNCFGEFGLWYRNLFEFIIVYATTKSCDIVYQLLSFRI
uniref:Uncharacterized protein n=1 Tax=Kalanchoe fedtschenkoi TaxID=63787 RepID=A0A7N0UGT5_KALFE